MINVYGRLVNKEVAKYRVSWEKPSRSKLQTRVKKLLHPVWINHVVFEEFPVYGTLLRIDFFNATKKIALEVDGPQHDEIIPYFHGNVPLLGFADSLKRDLDKIKWCERNDIEVIRIIEADLSDLRKFYERIQNIH